MKLPYRFIILSLLTATCACTPAPAKKPDPMANFARLASGDWQVTFGNGTSQYSSWQWGPGRHSISEPGLELYYWHPGRKQVRILSMHPDIPGVGRGVGEGTMRFEGDTAEGVLDLYQPRGLRKLGIRWSFDGPDKYHDTLLEDSGGPQGMQLQNEWDRYRVPKRSEAAHPEVTETPKLSEPMKVFEQLLGGTWGSPTTQTTFEWIPEYVHARVVAPSQDGESTHLLDAYFYQHVKTGRLCCLALSQQGGVYEGEFRVLEDSALQLELQGYEEDRMVPLLVRIDFEKDGTLRERIWAVDGSERKLMLDVKHKKLEPKKS